MKRAVFPGSFDPLTNGHVDIIRRAAGIFDEVTVLVACNVSKTCLFTPSERVGMIELVFSDTPSVRVDSWDGLTVEYAAKHSIEFIIRGLRDSRDFEYEHEMEINNRFLSPSIETVYLSSGVDKTYVRSTSVREFVRFGADFSSLVPGVVYSEIMKKMSSK